MSKMARRITEKVPDEQLHKDLEKYRHRAIELGAIDAKIITTDMVLIDERVRAKCNTPLCGYYGSSVNCPPNAPALDFTRRIVKNFHYAIFIRLEIPPEEVAGDEFKNKKSHDSTSSRNYEIVSKIESAAFYDGYHLAVGFADGPCKLLVCLDKECSALMPGQPCRHALRGRHSMEGVGMDVFTMAAKVGWEVYPIGWVSQPSEIPCATRMGLILIY
ncbi:DUF2284 domain-containing protein [Chloroflexota bacterium]